MTTVWKGFSGWAAAVAVLLQLCVFFVPIFSDLKVKNEYFYLEQKTFLDDGRVVSNAEFERDNLVLGEPKASYPGQPTSLNALHHEKFNINRVPDLRFLPFGVFGDVSQPTNPYHYLADRPDRLLAIDPLVDRDIVYAHPRLFSALYWDCENAAEVNAAFENQELLRAGRVGGRDTGLWLPDCKKGSKKPLYPLVVARNDNELASKIDYIEKNIDEKLLQAFDRYYFHESSFVLAPINEIKLGKPLNEVFSQYGYLSVLGISGIMDALGGFSIPNYEKAIKLSYLLYYFVFIFVATKIFRARLSVFCIVLVFSAGHYLNSYYFFQYPPGHAPFRHFFDMAILYFVWRYEQRLRVSDGVLALIFVVLAIFANKEYGAMVAAAFLSAWLYILVKGYCLERRFSFAELLLWIVSLAAVFSALFLYPLAPNPSSKYFLDGFYSFPLPVSYFLVVLVSILLQIVVLIFCGRRLYDNKALFVFVFGAIYSQLLYFYFVWGGGHAHFFAVLSIYALPYLVFVDTLDKRWAFVRNGALRCVNAALVVIVALSGFQFLKDFLYAEKSFNYHQTYRWELPRARGMITKTDPSLFEDSVRLIRRYSEGNQIFSISKYDNILSILSEKYSGLSFFELRSMLVTKTEYDQVRKELEVASVVYVDNDIDRDFDAELSQELLWNLLPSMYYEHKYQRIPKLKVLRQLYRDVILGHFELVDRGKLISVYRRR